MARELPPTGHRAKTDYAVTIVGGGPVGLMAANLLGQYQISTLLIEQHEEHLSIPRAISFDDEIMQLFRSVGLGDKIAENSKPVQGLKLLTEQRKLLLALCKERLHPQLPSSWLFFQPELESTLRDSLKQFPWVTMETGTTFLYAESRDTLVKVTLEKASGKHQISTAFMLGCDGARSTVVQAMGFPSKKTGFRAANFKMDTVAAAPYPNKTEWIEKISSSKKPYVFLDGRRGHFRWEFHLAANATVHHQALESLVSQQLGIELSILHSKRYIFESCYATKWQQGKVFIAGDAAHTMPPYIGQGMCSGMRDVQNLIWKLYFVQKGYASKKILSSYEQERKRHAKFVIRLTELVGQLYIGKLSALLRAFAPWFPKSLKTITVATPKIRQAGFPWWSQSGKPVALPPIFGNGKLLFIKGFLLVVPESRCLNILEQDLWQWLLQLEFTIITLENEQEKQIVNGKEIDGLQTDLGSWRLVFQDRIKVSIVRPDGILYVKIPYGLLGKYLIKLRKSLK